MNTRIEMEALEAVVHYLPQIANSLSRIANTLNRAHPRPIIVKPPEDEDEEP